MRISVINLSHGLLGDIEVITAIRAINRQIEEDFSPYWNMHGQLRLEGNSADEPDVDNPEDMQGEAIIYLWDKSDVPNALGYHEANYRGIPYGFVFIDIATEIGESWTATFSHEALELIGDRQASKLVRGPHPEDPQRQVYHWHEMCDAVQDETYLIDGVEVSNFVLPLYFTEGAEPGSRNDFLGTKYYDGDSDVIRSLNSFGINPGGYIGFYDPVSAEHETVMGSDINASHRTDCTSCERADYRRRRKNKARMARRGNRYSEMGANTAGLSRDVKKRRKQKLLVRERELTIRCYTDDIVVQTDVPTLKKETRQTRGYFAHDIYSDAGRVDSELQQSGFEEIAALEIDPVSKQDTSKKPKAEIGIKHEEDEAVIAMVDVDGIIFWKMAESVQGGTSIFNVTLQTAEQNKRSRRGFLIKGAKTLVRFIRHKIVDNVRDLIKNNLSEYLAKSVEKVVFGKGNPAKLHYIKLLDSPTNKTIGEVKDLTGNLPENKKYLLLVHGIFSSTRGAFSEFLLNRWDDELLIKLDHVYDKIVSFDHWTVAKSTLENATALLAKLPKNCEIDIVCHSRGAGVTRCLLEHPQLAPTLGANNIKVGKVYFAAGACQGSELANPSRIGTLVNVFSALTSLSGSYLPLKLFTGLLKAVEYGVKKFPGIQAMSPNSPIFKELNKPVNQPDCEYIYTRSNYEPSGKLKNMLDEIGLDQFVFKGKRNDVVVPFQGAGTFDDHVIDTIKVTRGPEFGKTVREHVFHTEIFEQQQVRQSLIHHLTG